jgi:DNA polymerase-3 subunit delta
MSVPRIISDWKKNIFKPLYWLEGDEEFFIDEIMNYAEKEILSPADAGFNLTVFYGKDANWPDVINACRRYPMFAERQVVLLKEAQQMKDLNKLESYFENPLSTTLLVVSNKGKVLTANSKMAKYIKSKGELFLSKKMYDEKLPAWVSEYLKDAGFQITSKALNLLVEHIGNDLSRIVKEIEKLSLNLSDKKNITENDIEKYIGISKEYNISEFQNALCKRDQAKAVRIIQYFEANQKAAPAQYLLTSLYGFFSKVLSVYQLKDKSAKAIKPLFYFNPTVVEQASLTLKNYSFEDVEKIILLLHDCNLKSIGIGSPAVSFGSLIKELSYKIISCGKRS